MNISTAELTRRSQAFDDACLDELGTISAHGDASLIDELSAEERQGLPPIQLEDRPETPAELKILGRIGEGGMAVVVAATQTALRRTVAVKRLKDGGLRPAQIRQLVAEARLTGNLEHPNIIPIYSLRGDGGGAPLLVMKRIDGRSWLDLVTEGVRPPGWAAGDPLAWHLGILMKVCDAVEFAHSRGIVHRDIKPSNVMVGEFGEVYLLDWGIAVEIDPNEDAEPNLVGSPGYMAPEMLTGRRRDITPATDVYLLGATLHRVLVGRPRHVGESAQKIWESVWASEPWDYGPGIPEELAAALHRAMHPDPQRRFPSAAALHEALADLLRHRGSVGLAADASARLVDLEARLAAGDVGGDVGLARALGECEFGFRRALEEWAGNRRAMAGLQRTLELSLDEEIRRRDLEGARRLVESMPAATDAHRARLEALAREVAAEERDLRRLKSLEAQLDLGSAWRWRVGFALATLLIAVAGPLGMAALIDARGGALTHEGSIGSAALMASTFWLLVLALRERVLANVAQRSLTFSALIGSGLLVLGRAWGALIGLEPMQAVAVDGFVFGAVAAVAAVTLDRRVWLTVPAFLGTAFAAAAWPAHALTICGVGNLVAFSLLALRWKGRVGSQAAG